MPEYLSPGVYIKEVEIDPKPIEGVGTSTAGFLGIAEKGPYAGTPNLIQSFNEYIRIFGGYLPKRDFSSLRFLPFAVNNFFKNGGKRCYILRINPSKNIKMPLTARDFEGTDTDPTNKTGLKAFAGICDVNIMAFPGITEENVPGAQKALVNHCQELKNRFAIIDLPENIQQISDVKTYRNNFDSSFAALYYPWIEAFDPLEGNSIFVPPSGSIAGIYARCDINRGVSKAPANEIVQNTSNVKLTVTNGTQNILNPLGVNIIRQFTGRGIRVWGARTMSSDPLWKYINIRRLFIFLEESIKQGTRWVVFELNNEKLWAKVNQTVTNFLYTVWISGALMGKTPQEAFFVKCDRTTMTQNDIDNGRLIILVGVAPIKPAEFVIFRIAQWQAGSATTE